MPLVLAFVMVLAFLLLLSAVRSLVVAIKAIVPTLLSVGSACGLLVLVFEHGIGRQLIGQQQTTGIIAWLPEFLFVVLFGLSMDYHVFILSRVREAVDRGASTEDAVRHGIRASAGVVTSAAVVMVAVFSIFATLSVIDMKQLGFGFAAAILIDATLFRVVLLPALMKLLGEWNWYMPRWEMRRRWRRWLARGQSTSGLRAPAVFEVRAVEDGHPESRGGLELIVVGRIGGDQPQPRGGSAGELSKCRPDRRPQAVGA